MITYEQVVDLWQHKKISTGADLSAIMNERSISFAYNSCKIENENITYNDTREIFNNDGVINYTGDLRTLFEIRNAKLANELFYTAFDEKRVLDQELLQRFQRNITLNTYDERRWQIGERPGQYKHHDFVTGKNEVGALPEDVEMELAELLDEMQGISDKDILVASAYFHAKFENIHPFADGNGRTGRLAMNYLLVTHNHPPIIIHAEDKKEYYQALEAWDSRQSLKEFVSYLKDQSVKTWERRFERELSSNKSLANDISTLFKMSLHENGIYTDNGSLTNLDTILKEVEKKIGTKLITVSSSIDGKLTGVKSAAMPDKVISIGEPVTYTPIQREKPIKQHDRTHNKKHSQERNH